ncbi:putative ferric-chelate reductase 1 [Solea solea]|uniref:putative ferric-chelate reductase 1 n=1 Tax=Solea solea TaxID=90069 RepID=UPI00272DBDC2|nr:putative ferric-chelate reductase 1 [Solea solea]
MSCLFLLLTLLMRSVAPVTGFSNGKVSVACGDMVPQHGHQPRPDPPPYNITVDKSTFSPGDNITVSLQVASSKPTFFKGFLMEARDAGTLDSPAVGFFMLTDPHESRLLQCGHTQGSGVSHRSSTRKTCIKAVWKSPQEPPLSVQFLATVVHEYKVYWVRIPGPVVSLRGGGTAAPFTDSPSLTTSSSAPPPLFTSVGCGHSKTCLRDPVGCHPDSDPHCFFLSLTTDEAGQSVMFELSGPAEGYVAAALSLDKWMGNDDVYLCVNDGGRVTISAAYVSGRTHPELATEDNLWGQSWRLADGVIQCRFHRNIILSNRFTLNQSYYLFMANGSSHHSLIHRHDYQPLISTNQQLITGPPVDLTGSRSPLLIKFHGVLMLTAWMWTVSTAVIIARHYKYFWLHTTLLGKRPWFQFHRTLMVLAVVLTSVAFSLPFIYRRGWSKRAGFHAYIGCTVMALSVIQPIMATLRPVPDSPRRIIFSWLHFGAGSVLHILAMVCVFLGVAQQALLLPSPWSPAVLTGWLLWIMLTDLLLLIHTYTLRNTGNDDNDDKEHMLCPHTETGQQREIPQLKNVVLIVFIIGNTGFLSAFIKAIASL